MVNVATKPRKQEFPPADIGWTDRIGPSWNAQTLNVNRRTSLKSRRQKTPPPIQLKMKSTLQFASKVHVTLSSEVFTFAMKLHYCFPPKACRTYNIFIGFNGVDITMLTTNFPYNTLNTALTRTTVVNTGSPHEMNEQRQCPPDGKGPQEAKTTYPIHHLAHPFLNPITFFNEMNKKNLSICPYDCSIIDGT